MRSATTSFWHSDAVRGPSTPTGLLIGCLTLLIYALAFGVVTHLFVLVYEEPTLRRTYGAQYEAYAAEVRRWMPRLTPWYSGAPSRPTPPA